VSASCLRKSVTILSLTSFANATALDGPPDRSNSAKAVTAKLRTEWNLTRFRRVCPASAAGSVESKITVNVHGHEILELRARRPGPISAAGCSLKLTMFFSAQLRTEGQSPPLQFGHSSTLSEPRFEAAPGGSEPSFEAGSEPRFEAGSARRWSFGHFTTVPFSSDKTWFEGRGEDSLLPPQFRRFQDHKLPLTCTVMRY
jgi:hypothetical protein